MKSLLFVALCLAALFASATPSYALGGRRGGSMMVCNVAQAAPVQATAQNLVQTAAVRVLNPIAPERKPLLIAKSRSGVDLGALQALNSRAPTSSPAASGARQLVSK